MTKEGTHEKASGPRIQRKGPRSTAKSVDSLATVEDAWLDMKVDTKIMIATAASMVETESRLN